MQRAWVDFKMMNRKKRMSSFETHISYFQSCTKNTSKVQFFGESDLFLGVSKYFHTRKFEMNHSYLVAAYSVSDRPFPGRKISRRPAHFGKFAQMTHNSSNIAKIPPNIRPRVVGAAVFIIYWRYKNPIKIGFDTSRIQIIVHGEGS